MPNISSTGLMGDGHLQEPIATPTTSVWMKRCSRRWIQCGSPRRRLPDLATTAMRAHTSQGATASVEPLSGWMQTTAPPKPRRPSVTGWVPGTASPTTLTRHAPPKRLSVSPEGNLGGCCFQGLIRKEPHCSMRSGRRLSEQPHQDDSPVGDQDDSAD